MSSDPWGRVDETGTVYVRTADGEQVVGSWQAGSPEEALAYFERKYEGLVVEIGLLEQRVKTTDLSAEGRPGGDRPPARAGRRAPRGRRPGRAAVAAGQARRDRRGAPRGAQGAAGASSPTRRGTPRRRWSSRPRSWRSPTSGGPPVSGCARWWTPGRGCRGSTASRTTSCGTASRTPARRSPSAARRTSPRWTRSARRPARPRRSWSPRPRRCPARPTGVPTAARYRELMTEWKAAGRAQREVEDDLWNRFRGAQDVFFAARSAVFAERDAEQAREPQAQGGAGRRGREAAAGHGPEGGPGRVPLDQRALGGHRPCAARRPPEGRGPDARGRAGPPGVRGDRVAPDEPGGTRACRGSDRSAPGRRGQAARARSRRPARRATTPGPTSSQQELEGRQALLDQALKGLQEFGG